MAQHAILSPSAAHRWLRCTAAPMLEAQVPDTGSEYAAEGSLAHALAARDIKSWLGQRHTEEDAQIAALRDRYHSGEMDEHVEGYREYVFDRLNYHRKRLKESTLLVEVRLDLSAYVPECYGTSDAVIIGDGELEVIDLKYGKGVAVDAEANPQMMIYALGALDRFGEDYDIQRVKMSIYQPRLSTISEWETSVEDLCAWAETVLIPKAKEAMAGGTQEAGDWCRFCKVKGQCRALFDEVQQTDVEDDPKLMSDDDIAQALRTLPLLKQWITAVEEHALAQALGGTHYTGYKLVEGRSVRKIVDPDGAMAALRDAGYAPEVVVRPTELRTLTDLERLVGKKRLAEIIGRYIEKPAGKPALVAESDKRPALDRAAEMFGGLPV